MTTNSIMEAMRAALIYGRFSSYKDHQAMWEPLNRWSIKWGHGRRGTWYSPHISKENLEKYDPRIELYNRYQEGCKTSQFLFQLYDIPAEEQCNIKNILKVGYNIGLYQGWYGYVSNIYEKDYYTSLFDENKLGNVNTYVKNNAGIELFPVEFLDLTSLLHRQMEC